MPYFLDSNVILGFVFPHSDRHGKWACEVMDKPEEKHSGYTVRVECFGEDDMGGRAHEISDEIYAEGLDVRKKILKYGAIEFRLQFDVKKFPRTGPILQKLFDAGRISDNSVLSRDFLWHLEANYPQRKKHALKGDLVVWHGQRVKEYPDQRDALCKHIKNLNDVEVLLDAHDVGVEVGGVVFVTGDQKDIGKHRDVIRRFLTGVVDVEIHYAS